MRAGRHSPVRLRRIRPQSRTVACRRKTTEPRRAPERRISSLPCHIARNHRIRPEERRTQCVPCHCRRNTNPHNPADSADIHTESAEFFYAARRRLAQRRDSPNYGSATGRTGISWCLQQRCERGGGSWNIVRIAVPHMTRAVGSASSAALRGNPPLERRVLLRYRPLRYPCRTMATWRRSHRFHRLREHLRRHPMMVLPHSQRMRAMPAHLRPSPPGTPPRHRPIPPDPPPRSRPPSAHA